MIQRADVARSFSCAVIRRGAKAPRYVLRDHHRLNPSMNAVTAWLTSASTCAVNGDVRGS